MKIAIVTDDNAYFTKDELKGLPIFTVRMPILIDGVCYFENDNLTENEFYNKLNKANNVSTSQPAPGEVLALWDKILKDYDAILHIPMSSGLSCSTNSAKILAEDYKDKVFVVDNHRISVTLKRSIYDAINLIKLGKSPLEIKNILEETKADSNIFIMVDTLTYLKKGGRITPAAALIGNTLHLKPILTIDGEKLDAKSKAIGTKNGKKIMLQLIRDLLNTKYKDIPFEDLEFAIAYTHNLEDANTFKSEFINEFHPTNLVMNPLSLSIGVHIGPGSLAVTVSKIIK
jgi:EDD domain protein, DegV family